MIESHKMMPELTELKLRYWELSQHILKEHLSSIYYHFYDNPNDERTEVEKLRYRLHVLNNLHRIHCHNVKYFECSKCGDWVEGPLMLQKLADRPLCETCWKGLSDGSS